MSIERVLGSDVLRTALLHVLEEEAPHEVHEAAPHADAGDIAIAVAYFWFFGMFFYHYFLWPILLLLVNTDHTF